MRKLYIVIFYILIGVTGCANEFSAFQLEALNYAADGKVDRSEFNRLLTHISKFQKERDFKILFFTTNRLDSNKVVNYLNKLYLSKNMKVDEIRTNDIINKAVTKFNINVYLENSASMDAYVNGPTDFKDAVYSLLGDVSLSPFCASLNLNYINTTIPYTKNQASSDDIRNFIYSLTPKTFKQRGGNRTSSDLKDILQRVLNRTDNKNASVLISDFVFSPGKKVNAHNYLSSESIGIKIDFANKLKAFDLSVLAIQLSSKFKGFYYDQVDDPSYLDGKRPYYIWIIGNSNQLRSILKSGLINNIRGGYLNKVLFQSIKQPDNPEYKILYTGKVGSFRLKEGARGPITDAIVSDMPRTSGKFVFNVAVDFSQNLQDAIFFDDSTNYEENKNYTLSIASINDPTNISLKGFTHLLKLSTSDLKKEPINIAVKGHVPGWVVRSNSENDVAAATDVNERNKTFGLKYLVEGVANAFYPADNNTISKIEILIN